MQTSPTQTKAKPKYALKYFFRNVYRISKPKAKITWFYLKVTSRYLFTNLKLFIKALIQIAYKLFSYLFLGAFSGIIDMVHHNHKRSSHQNLALVTINLLTIIGLGYYLFQASQATAKFTSQASQPFISLATQQTKTHINQLNNNPKGVTPTTNTENTPNFLKPTQVTIPANSPLAKKQVQVSSYNSKTKQLTIAKELFTNQDPKTLNTDQVFINQIAPDAQIAALSYGLRPSVLIAQAYLESGAGQSDLAKNWHNYFGIKYRGTGKLVNMPTQEDDGSGNKYTINAKFQAYDSIQDSMIGNAQLLRNGITGNPNKYAKTWLENSNSYQDVTQALTGTYATDTHYNQLLNKFIQTYHLDQLDPKN